MEVGFEDSALDDILTGIEQVERRLISGKLHPLMFREKLSKPRRPISSLHKKGWMQYDRLRQRISITII